VARVHIEKVGQFLKRKVLVVALFADAAAEPLE
jgi:hypothetical protein